jgi:hypothetical protein
MKTYFESIPGLGLQPYRIIHYNEETIDEIKNILDKKYMNKFSLTAQLFLAMAYQYTRCLTNCKAISVKYDDIEFYNKEFIDRKLLIEFDIVVLDDNSIITRFSDINIDEYSSKKWIKAYILESDLIPKFRKQYDHRKRLNFKTI